VDVPDHQLNEEELKEKRKQRLLKAGYDARSRAKAEREAERLRQVCCRSMDPSQIRLTWNVHLGLQEEEIRKDDAARAENPQAWLASVRKQHEVNRRTGVTTLITDSMLR
jgi:actin-related protein 5